MDPLGLCGLAFGFKELKPNCPRLSGISCLEENSKARAISCCSSFPFLMGEKKGNGGTNQGEQKKGEEEMEGGERKKGQDENIK